MLLKDAPRLSHLIDMLGEDDEVRVAHGYKHAFIDAAMGYEQAFILECRLKHVYRDVLHRPVLHVEQECLHA